MSVQPPRDRYPDSADSGAETVGPYQLVSQVAIGELASLYVARPVSGPAPARPLLVKRLVSKHARNPEYQAALRREAELSASLLSTDIVRTLSVESSPEVFSVMERIEGGNLAVLLAQARHHDLDTARFAMPIIVGALRALDYLHRGHDPTSSSFLVHQAPVARHIMADFEGRSHIIDLTLAMGPAQPRPTLTDQRLRPYEMAPEQALAPHTVDPRCDIFIVGMTLWETLTGQRLFAGRSPIEAQKKMLSGAIVPPSETGTGAHHCFDKLCMRALARTRGTRFPSAAEMASELQDEAVRAGLYAEPAELGEWVRSTMALGRRPAPAVASAPLSRTLSYDGAPRDARADVTTVAKHTMMGIGGPNADVLKIAEAYRESESLKQTRSGRRGRSATARSSAPGAAPMLRASPDEARSSTSAAHSQPRDSVRAARSSVAEDAREAGFSLVGAPARQAHGGLSELGLSAAGSAPQLGLGSSDEWLPATRGGAGISFTKLSIAGVITAGLLALMVRGLSGNSDKPFRFGPAPLPGASTAAPAASVRADAEDPRVSKTSTDRSRAEAPSASTTGASDAPTAGDLPRPGSAEDQAAALLPQPALALDVPADSTTPGGAVEAQAAEPAPVAVETVRSTPLKPVTDGTRGSAHAIGRSGETRRVPAKSSAPATTPTPVPVDTPAPAVAEPSTTAAPRWQAPSTLNSRPSTVGSKQAKWVAPSPATRPAVTPDAPRWGNPPAPATGTTTLPDNPF